MPFARYFCIFINVGLGTAATKNVGTGSGQIPDMSSFSSGSGWQVLPGGVIIQWGNAISGQTGDAKTNPFPIAFTDLASIQIVATYDNPDAPNGPVHFGAKANTTSSFRLLNSLPNANVAYARWIAIGR
ncbi:TPA: gp53-like domain-containing protein [Escherichia coli]